MLYYQNAFNEIQMERVAIIYIYLGNQIDN